MIPQTAPLVVLPGGIPLLELSLGFLYGRGLFYARHGRWFPPHGSSDTRLLDPLPLSFHQLPSTRHFVPFSSSCHGSFDSREEQCLMMTQTAPLVGLSEVGLELSFARGSSDTRLLDPLLLSFHHQLPSTRHFLPFSSSCHGSFDSREEQCLHQTAPLVGLSEVIPLLELSLARGPSDTRLLDPLLSFHQLPSTPHFVSFSLFCPSFWVCAFWEPCRLLSLQKQNVCLAQRRGRPPRLVLAWW